MQSICELERTSIIDVAFVPLYCLDHQLNRLRTFVEQLTVVCLCVDHQQLQVSGQLHASIWQQLGCSRFRNGFILLLNEVHYSCLFDLSFRLAQYRLYLQCLIKLDKRFQEVRLWEKLVDQFINDRQRQHSAFADKWDEVVWHPIRNSL